MKREVVLLAALALGGCQADRAKHVAACQREADRFYPSYLAVDPNSPGARFIVACMNARGYELTVTADECSSRYPLATQATCYTRDSWIAELIAHFRSPAPSADAGPSKR